MYIFVDAITQLAGEGRLTLQVPEQDISFGYVMPTERTEVPDDWFETLRHGYKIKNPPTEFAHPEFSTSMRRCFGKEQGFLHLTRKGFEANKEAIKEAWLNGGRYGVPTNQPWEDFERYAEFHFANVDISTERYRQSKIASLNKALTSL